jgi:hypothetical protein
MHSANIDENTNAYRFLKNQKKSTPSKNPINKGGSPSGVAAPPIFEMRKMKNTTMCAMFFLPEFALNNGLISIVDAPVVPIHPANILPKNKKTVLKKGPQALRKSIKIPPDTIYKAAISTINGI